MVSAWELGLQTRKSWSPRCIGAAAVALLGVTAGCADVEPTAERGGLQLQFAALAPSGCLTSTAGRNSVPETVATVVVAIRAGDLPPRIERIGRAKLMSAGQWLIPDVKAGVPIDVEVWGCGADKSVGWAGRSNGLEVEAQKEATTQVFLAPTAALGCTGSDAKSVTAGETDHLQSGRSLSAVAALAGGDVVVVGGIGSWSGKDRKGLASRDIDIFDHRVGAFHKGPQLQSARVWHHAIAIGPQQVLVVGGVTQVQQIGATNLPTPLLMPAKPDDAAPLTAVELVDLQLGTSRKVPVAAGAGLQLLSSAVPALGGALFVGGVDGGGAATKVATHLSDFAAIIGGGGGKATSLSLGVARARPGLVVLEGGGVLIVGGNLDGAAGQGFELVTDVAKGAVALPVVGDATLTTSKGLMTISPTVVSLGVRNGAEAVLVMGGLGASSITAEQSQTYLARVDAGAAKVTVVGVDLGGKSLLGGFAGLGVRVPGGALVAAGAIKLTGGAPCVASAAECIGADLWRVALGADAGAGVGAQPLTLQVVEALGGPRFGLVGSAVPGGTLLVGGQSTLVESGVEGAAALDPTGRLLARLPSDPALGALCP